MSVMHAEDREALADYFQHTVIEALEAFLFGLENQTVEKHTDIRRLGTAAEACRSLAERIFSTDGIDLNWNRRPKGS
ncbi:MAG TPA: hypothetical protein VM469_09135, partial [Pseudoxanthomonas sp.]|nr:hypothetical protein [Pseudoxanthomonas sp.]